ncbi:transmembrane protein 198-B [Puntigrus tetrazona]|uniref:transmembrane protein 198-B n=1 Tax=Puntigrus tetrazona TaxID=1606681 RepID=UPI001C8A77E7|nr:transmembrane protein 198-B [Puntigrus tetrazona]XP_043104991.1 transmembrane protein 198-B [Puntigrus tetrazona]
MTSTAQILAFKLSPPSQDGSPERLFSCDEDIERRYEVVPSVVCSMCCLFGIIYCFFGYRCFKAVMFLTGLMFGSIIIFMLCYKERVMDTQLSVEASVGIGLGIGTLCGLVTMLVRSVGLFMVGLLLGLLVALASLVVLEEFYHPRTVWLPLGVLLGSGMLFAVLTLQWQRCFTTLSTAVFGSAVVTVTVDYFVELFALTRYIYERVKVDPPRPVCWFTWVVMGVWPVLALLGVLIQWKVTAEGYSHTEVFISHQQRRVQLMRIRQKEERRECRKKKKKKPQKQPPQQQKYHHPPQTNPHPPNPPPKLQPPEPTHRRKPNTIRRFDGDVLSPSYIQNFRDRRTDRRGYSHGRLIGGSHVVDLDYDYGSQVPLTAHTGPAVRG